MQKYLLTGKKNLKKLVKRARFMKQCKLNGLKGDFLTKMGKLHGDYAISGLPDIWRIAQSQSKEESSDASFW